MFHTSVNLFFSNLPLAKNMVQVIEGKINYRNDLKGNKNYFQLLGGLSYRGFEMTVNVWRESTLVRVSTRPELVMV